MGDTTIEWTDKTWNPIRGCSRVSEGCRNCYAEGVAYRFSGPGQAYEGLIRIGADGARKRQWNGNVQFVPRHLRDPLSWKEPQRIFVNSMSDLFHENVKDSWIDQIFAVMALCPQHTFQILTKRPQRMQKYITQLLHQQEVHRIAQCADKIRMGGPDTPYWLSNYAYQPGYNSARHIPPLPNVWLGVSCEDQKAADERIPLLLQTPAAVRFISAEPLLGPIDLDSLPSYSGIGRYLDSLSNAGVDPGAEISTRLDWVIVGGESGHGARPMERAWAESLRDQCAATGAAFFVKQMGSVYGANKGKNIPPELLIRQMPYN